MKQINPDYYKNKIQVTDFIVEYKLDFLEGNIIKYIVRHKKKNGLEDILKAVWYIDKLLEDNYGTTLQEHLKEYTQEAKTKYASRGPNGSDEKKESMGN